MTDKPPVTVLGLGAMGTALARTLLNAGYPTTVWNRTASKTAPLTELGAHAADSPADAIARGELVLACLLDYDSVHQTLAGTGDALRGKAFVNLTNGTPEQARALAGKLDTAYLDGGIMAVPPMIGSPGAFLFYSGEIAVFEQYRPVLESFGEAIEVGTDPGLAALHDLALLSAMYGMFGGVLQAFALTGSAGVSAASLAPLLHRWLDGMSGFIAQSAAQLDSGDFATGVVSNLAMQDTGFANLFRAAKEQGISTGQLEPLGALIRRRVEDGHGAEDLAGIVEYLKIGANA
ncbi:NAD(P)-binding domain-containing protein [Sciscionella marina]|uniref:imine reductase family protein n=1 Tax=Sciscionella marina TaxID=508770 RepID=UPI000381A857